ncbi:MAG TPA: YwbE family protein [Patescibacteria group bacterium]|nr:YwbE family protein [Patescibacteria group bacterium]
MDGQNRENVKIGSEVEIVLKKDQRTGKLTRGIVAEILTSSAFHPRGIKVRLKNGQVGRVQKIYPVFPKMNGQEYQEGLI